MSGLPGAEPKLFVISYSILNAVATATHDVITEQKSSFSSEGMDARGCVNDREAEDQGTGMKSRLERLPNEILIMVFETLAGEDELAITSRVSLALTSKRFARLAVQIAVQLPTCLSFDEKLFNSSRRNRKVQREKFMVLTAAHHELMVALREWIPAKMFYCAYCGTWKTSCNAHDACSEVLESGLLQSWEITADGKLCICLTCHTKGRTRLPKRGDEYRLIMFAEWCRYFKRKLEQIKLQIQGLADR